MTDDKSKKSATGNPAYMELPEDVRKELEERTGITIDSDKAFSRALDISSGFTDRGVAEKIQGIEQRALEKLRQQKAQQSKKS